MAAAGAAAIEVLHVGGYVRGSECEEATVCCFTSSGRTVKRTGSETMGVLTCLVFGNWIVIRQLPNYRVAEGRA